MLLRDGHLAAGKIVHGTVNSEIREACMYVTRFYTTWSTSLHSEVD